MQAKPKFESKAQYNIPERLQERVLPDMAQSDWLWIAGITFLALIPRLYLLFQTDFGIEGDEAIVGLMAKHMLEGSAWPVFYYGQDYMGSLEAILVAAGFFVFGVSNVVLKCVPLLFSLLFVALVYALTLRLSDRHGARVAALLAALAPSALILWSTKARGGFIEILVLGTLSLILAVDILSGKHRRFFLLGLILGLGWWVNNQIVYYMLPVGLVVGGVCLYRDGILRSPRKASQNCLQKIFRKHLQ